MEIINNNNILGESPLWNKHDGKYYWIDIIDRKIKRYSDKIEEFPLKKMPCCINLKDNNTIIMALEDEIGIYDLRTHRFNSQFKIDGSTVRFNDGKLDNNGILHIGTMDRNEKSHIGNIFKYQNGYLDKLYSNIGIANGISFDESNKMYHSDSLDGKLYYNGKLINTYNNIGPDGACYHNGKYYICLWGGSRIDVYKHQKVIEKIELPVKYPTCCCFGGSNMDNMYITSASILDSSKINGKCLLIK